MARQSTVPTVTLLDDVEKCEKEVIESLLALPDRKPVNLVINSGGGSVYASFGIATTIRMKALQATAIVLADCSSSALLVFASCSQRYVAPHASFLFHPMRWSSEDQSRLSGAKSWSSEFERVTAESEEWLAQRLPMHKRTLRKWIREERYVPAHELVEMGLADYLDLEDPNVIDITVRSRPRRAAARTRQVRKVG